MHCTGLLSMECDCMYVCLSVYGSVLLTDDMSYHEELGSTAAW